MGKHQFFLESNLSTLTFHSFCLCSNCCCCCSVAKLCLTLCDPHGRQHASLVPCPSLAPRVCSNSYPLSWWCHPTISSSVAPFSSYPQSFTASGAFPASQFFASGGQSVGVSASASVLPMNIQDWFPLASTGLMSLKSKGLSRAHHHSSQYCKSVVLNL